MRNDLEPGVQVGTLGFHRASRYKADLHSRRRRAPAIHKMFRDTILKAGILNNDGEPKITFHGLRHTHATILLNSGQNVKAIAQRLGNTPAMIYEIYGHVMKE